MFQLVVVEVGGSQRHHEVPEPDERTVGVCEQTDNHVTIEDSHGRLVTVLQCQHSARNLIKLREEKSIVKL